MSLNVSLMSTSESQRVLRAALERRSVADLLQFHLDKGSAASTQSLVSATSHTSLHDALALLAAHNLSALPVEDADERGAWLGFVDVLDVLVCVLRVFRAGVDVHPSPAPTHTPSPPSSSTSATLAESEDGAPYDWQQWRAQLQTLEHRGVRLALLPVSRALNASARDAWCPVSAQGSLLQLAETFARGVHRVPVQSALPRERERVLGVASQSDLLRLLLAPLTLSRASADFPSASDSSDDAVASALHSFLEQPIDALSLLGAASAASVVSVGVHASAVQALWTMHVSRVSFCAVVDARGALLATVAASALRALGTPALSFAALLEPLSALLSALPQSAALAVTASSALSVVVWKMALYGAHCVWVIDADQRPIAAITLTDVMRALVDWTERSD